MSIEFLNPNSDDFQKLINTFESRTNRNELVYFDIDEYETIIEYYRFNQDYRKLDIAIKNAMQIHPNAINFKLAKALRFSALKMNQKAISMIKDLLKIEPGNTDLIRALAHEYGKIRDYKNMESTYLILKDNEIDIVEVYLDIATEYLYSNNFENAIEYFKMFFKEQPDSDEFLDDVAMCYNEIGKSDEAIKFFESVIDDNPYSADAWFHLGSFFELQNLYEKAIECYDYSIAVDEEFAEAYSCKAEALTLLGYYEKAIDTYLESFKYVNPGHFDFYYIAENFEYLDDEISALKYYKKAIEADDSFADAFLRLAYIYFDRKKMTLALNYAKRAMEIDEDDKSVLLTSDILMDLEHYEEAIEILAKRIKDGSKNPNIFINLAEAFYLNEQTEHSIQVITKAIEIDSEDGNENINIRLFYYLFLFTYLNNQKKSAYKILENILVLDHELSSIFVIEEESIDLLADKTINDLLSQYS